MNINKYNEISIENPLNISTIIPALQTIEIHLRWKEI